MFDIVVASGGGCSCELKAAVVQLVRVTYSALSFCNQSIEVKLPLSGACLSDSILPFKVLKKLVTPQLATQYKLKATRQHRLESSTLITENCVVVWPFQTGLSFTALSFLLLIFTLKQSQIHTCLEFSRFLRIKNPRYSRLCNRA